MKNFVFNFEKFPAVGGPTNENFILPTDFTDFTNFYSVKNPICKIRIARLCRFYKGGTPTKRIRRPLKTNN